MSANISYVDYSCREALALQKSLTVCNRDETNRILQKLHSIHPTVPDLLLVHVGVAGP